MPSEATAKTARMPTSTLASIERHELAGRVEIGAERHDRDGGERRDDRDRRGHHEVELVHVAGQRLLLEEELAAVGQKVEHAEALETAPKEGNPRKPRHDDAVGPEAALDPRGDLALGHRARARDREDDADHRQALEQGQHDRR